MRDVDLEQLLEPQRARLSLDERHVVDAERVLHRRQPVELLEDGVGVEAVLDLDDQPQSVLAVGEVVDVGDALELLRPDEVGDLLVDLLGSDAVGQLGDDDALAPRASLGSTVPSLAYGRATARLVGLADAVEADDLAAGRRSGPGTNRIRSSRRRVG